MTHDEEETLNMEAEVWRASLLGACPSTRRLERCKLDVGQSVRVSYQKRDVLRDHVSKSHASSATSVVPSTRGIFQPKTTARLPLPLLLVSSCLWPLRMR